MMITTISTKLYAQHQDHTRPEEDTALTVTAQRHPQGAVLRHQKGQRVQGAQYRQGGQRAYHAEDLHHQRGQMAYHTEDLRHQTAHHVGDPYHQMGLAHHAGDQFQKALMAYLAGALHHRQFTRRGPGVQAKALTLGIVTKLVHRQGVVLIQKTAQHTQKVGIHVQIHLQINPKPQTDTQSGKPERQR